MATNDSQVPERHLGPFDAICVVIGIVVGVMIFAAPSWVASNTGSGSLMVLAWVLGGLFCLCGALSYVELATTYPRVGGEYFYLSRSFGRAIGFFFVWARSTVIQTGSIAMLAYVFGDYTARMFPEGTVSPMVCALLAIVILTVLNVVGWRTEKWTQNLLTAVKVVGVLAIVVVGLLIAAPAKASPSPVSSSSGGGGAFGLAMVFVLLTYGGWNEAAYVAGEVRNPRRNMLRVLVGSILLLTVLYVTVNLAYLRALGFGGMRSSNAVAADTVFRGLGKAGSAAVSILVAISALGAMQGCIFTGARAMYALGNDYRAFRPLGRWHKRFETPANAILVQSAIAVILILLPSMGPGFRKFLGSGFEAAAQYTFPVFWTFLLLTGLAVFVLRVKEPTVDRPFRVPFYPVTVALFCLMCGYMLYSSLAYTKLGALVGVGVLLVGVPVYALWCRAPKGKSETGAQGPE